MWGVCVVCVCVEQTRGTVVVFIDMVPSYDRGIIWYHSKSRHQMGTGVSHVTLAMLI